MARKRNVALICVFLPALVLPAGTGWTVRNDAADNPVPAGCSAMQQSDYPKALISNGLIHAVVLLPDANVGYYRGTRFDWSGVIGCLEYKSHNYFGVWFPHYDPHLHDAITGPVEEFRPRDANPLLYDRAKPGEPFVKVGVGVLRRIDDGPYRFTAAYPMVDGGKWSFQTKPDGVSFRHHLTGPSGISYIYKKTLKLEKRQPVLLVQHELRNTGTETIETDVYNHDFFVIDGTPTGPAMAVRFPFDPKAEPGLANGAAIKGKEIVYGRELQTGESAAGSLTGFSNNVSDYDFVVENRNTGVGVQQTGDLPISSMYFWSIRTTICPEAYVHLKVSPGETSRWTVRYRFYANNDN